MKKATFAGGCFWCMETAFKIIPGVQKVVSGYTGGDVENPSYELVSTGSTNHYESIQVTYNPDKVSYEKLLDIFWKSIDPTDEYGQFVDRGTQYKTAIFYHDNEQKKLAEQSKKQIEKELGKTIYTTILPVTKFYAAEDYHQNYSEKNPVQYKLYETASGRKRRLDELWKKKT